MLQNEELVRVMAGCTLGHIERVRELRKEGDFSLEEMLELAPMLRKASYEECNVFFQASSNEGCVFKKEEEKELRLRDSDDDLYRDDDDLYQ